MATFRQRALNEAASHQTDRYYVEEGPVSDYFGKNVLDLDKMQAYMSPQAYEAVLASVKFGAKLDRTLSDEIAEGMCSVKNMQSGEQVKLSPADAAQYIKDALSANNGPIILEK